MAFVVSFAFTLMAILILRWIASPIGLTVKPGSYRSHENETPLVGGLGMFLGITVGYLLIDGPWSLWMCALVIVIAGVWDDLHEISTGARFFAQIAAASMMIYWGDVVLFDLGYLITDEGLFYLGRWAVALTIFGSVGLMNAINMSDGLDGLAAGLAFVSACAIMLSALFAGDQQSIMELGVLLSVIAAFFIFNVRFDNSRPAHVFMGDAGSTLLGLFLGWYLIKHTQEPGKLFSPVTALWIVALPLFDGVGVLLRRLLKGQSPFSADRSHYHHYLLGIGLSVNQVLLISVALSVVLAGIGLSTYHAGVTERTMFSIFLVLFFVHLLLMEFAKRKYRL